MLSSILLQVEASAQGGSAWSFWVLLILLLGGIAYLIFARPFKKSEGKDKAVSVSSEEKSHNSATDQSAGGVVQNNQTIINVNSGSSLSSFGKILIVYGIWLALNLVCLFAKSDPSYGSVHLRDGYFWPFGRTDIFYYGNEEFVVYAIALPIIIGLIYWAYKRNK